MLAAGRRRSWRVSSLARSCPSETGAELFHPFSSSALPRSARNKSLSQQNMMSLRVARIISKTNQGAASQIRCKSSSSSSWVTDPVNAQAKTSHSATRYEDVQALQALLGESAQAFSFFASRRRMLEVDHLSNTVSDRWKSLSEDRQTFADHALPLKARKNASPLLSSRLEAQIPRSHAREEPSSSTAGSGTVGVDRLVSLSKRFQSVLRGVKKSRDAKAREEADLSAVGQTSSLVNARATSKKNKEVGESVRNEVVRFNTNHAPPAAESNPSADSAIDWAQTRILLTAHRKKMAEAAAGAAAEAEAQALSRHKRRQLAEEEFDLTVEQSRTMYEEILADSRRNADPNRMKKGEQALVKPDLVWAQRSETESFAKRKTAVKSLYGSLEKAHRGVMDVRKMRDARYNMPSSAALSASAPEQRERRRDVAMSGSDLAVELDPETQRGVRESTNVSDEVVNASTVSGNRAELRGQGKTQGRVPRRRLEHGLFLPLDEGCSLIRTLGMMEPQERPREYSGDPEAALAYKRMREELDKKNFRGVVDIFNGLRTKTHPNHFHLHTAQTAFMALDDDSAVLRLFDLARPTVCMPDPTFFNKAVTYFGKRMKRELAERVLKKQIDLGVPPDKFGLNALLILYGRSEEHPLHKVAEVFFAMRERGIHADEFSVSSLTRTLYYGPDLEEVGTLLQRYRNYDTIMYTLLLEAFCQAGKVREATMVAQKMEEERISLFPCSIESIFQMYLLVNQPDTARRIMAAYGRITGEVPLAMYIDLMRAYGDKLELQSLLSVFRELRRYYSKTEPVPREAYIPLVAYFANQGDMEGTETVLDLMKRHGGVGRLEEVHWLAHAQNRDFWNLAERVRKMHKAGRKRRLRSRAEALAAGAPSAEDVAKLIGDESMLHDEDEHEQEGYEPSSSYGDRRSSYGYGSSRGGGSGNRSRRGTSSSSGASSRSSYGNVMLASQFARGGSEGRGQAPRELSGGGGRGGGERGGNFSEFRPSMSHEEIRHRLFRMQSQRASSATSGFVRSGSGADPGSKYNANMGRGSGTKAKAGGKRSYAF